ncbi:MAG: putative sulfate exporter family transporter [Candidatus Dormibacteraeota bacterium]|nr:putative sulfate exporter family transporter [Candidatus Dormibacteraeota bacterium]
MPQRLSPRGRLSAGAILGVLLCVLVAAIATGLGRVVPLIGAPVVGLLLGVLLALTLRPARRVSPGITFCSHQVLQVAVAGLGLQLTLGQAVAAGSQSLPVLLGTLAICLVAAGLIGRFLTVRSNLRTLVGVGTAICGASAIAAVTPIIDAAAVDVTYALSTVFVFNAVAVVLFPLLGHALAMSQQAFGLFAGTAINDTSSVVAAGSVFGAEAGHHAVVVKLTRTLFIIPVCIGLAVWRGRRRDRKHVGMPGVTHLIPWFLVAFVALSALVSVVPPSAALRNAFSAVALFLITMALTAIGLSTDLRGVRTTGPRPLLLGALLWVVVSASSLLLAAATGIR